MKLDKEEDDILSAYEVRKAEAIVTFNQGTERNSVHGGANLP